MIRDILNGLFELIYPEKTRCAFCGSENGIGAAGLCSYCICLLPYISDNVCTKCGRQMEDNSPDVICSGCKLHRAIYFDQGMIVFRFEGRIQDAIYRLKYNGEQDMAAVIGMLMAKKLKTSGWNADVIIPVPLHKNRLTDRGYNQSHLLSMAIGRELGIDVDDRVLIRQKDTISQTQLTGLQRASNVRNAFEVTRQALVKRKIVLLVDDIMTTGATMNECSKTLKDNGADRVYYIAAASPIFNENCINAK